MEKGNYFVSTEEHCFCKNIIIYGYLRLAELGVLWHIFQLKGLQGAHGDDGVVSEQRFALLGFIHNTRKVSHYKIVIIKLFILYGWFLNLIFYDSRWTVLNLCFFVWKRYKDKESFNVLRSIATVFQIMNFILKIFRFWIFFQYLKFNLEIFYRR